MSNSRKPRMKRTSLLNPPKQERIFCSTMNSDFESSMAPPLEMPSLTPIPTTSSGNTTQRKGFEKKDDKPLQKENLLDKLDCAYVRYIQSVYKDIVVEEKLVKTKSELQHQMATLSKRLESQRVLLDKVHKRIRGISFASEKEMLSNLQKDNLDGMLEILDKNHPENVPEISRELEMESNSLRTKDIKVPLNCPGIAEFHKTMDEALVTLREIHNATSPYTESYSQAEENLNAIVTSHKITSDNLQKFQDLKPAVQSSLLLQCSREERKKLHKALEEVDSDDCESTLGILKKFSSELEGKVDID